MAIEPGMETASEIVIFNSSDDNYNMTSVCNDRANSDWGEKRWHKSKAAVGLLKWQKMAFGESDFIYASFEWILLYELPKQ